MALDGRRVLIVEDHPIFLDGLSLLLRRAGAGVVAVESAEAALDLLDADSRLHLIVIDLKLPGMDGVTLLEALREREVLIPIVVISAEEHVAAINRALELGALGYVPKSYRPQAILTAFTGVMNGQMQLATATRQKVDQYRRGLRQGLHRGGTDPVERNPLPTPRQLTVLRLMARGLSNKQIARALSLTEHTIKSHVRGLLRILETDNRTACVREATLRGLIAPAARDLPMSANDPR